MPGLSDYSAKNVLNYLTGSVAMPALPAVFLALFTTAPTSDAGTGGTEVSGGSYARVQVAGAVAAAASFTTASPNITMGANPGWVVPGMNAYDITNGQQLGTVLTYVSTALVLTANAAHASSGSTDSIAFSAFPLAAASTGTEPAVTPANSVNTNASIPFAQASANWGTVLAWGLYDASTAGNLLWFDWLGNNAYLPFSCSSASPGVVTAPAHGFANGNNVIVTAKFGGTLPATGGSWAGPLTVAGVSTDTFTAGVNTTGTGDGLVRKIAEQSIPSGVTATFGTSSFTLQLA